jgi:hypothetical protein
MVEALGAYRSITMEERFWGKVKKDGPVPARFELGRCWQWGGKLHDHGYGLFSTGGRHVRAHRVSWELHHARPIPAGEIVRHRCDNRACVNPGHLVLGNHADNAIDSIRRGRREILVGEKVPSAKLTTEQVQWARQQYDSGLATCTALSRELGVSNTAMSAVLKRQSWAHVK